jgi:hypothetical protein
VRHRIIFITVQKLVPVSAKGQVVISAQMRGKIVRVVIVKDEGSRILVEPSASIDESFGVDGDEMPDVARKISRERRTEAVKPYFVRVLCWGWNSTLGRRAGHAILP